MIAIFTMILFGGNDSKIPRNMETAHVASAQRDDVIYMMRHAGFSGNALRVAVNALYLRSLMLAKPLRYGAKNSGPSLGGKMASKVGVFFPKAPADFRMFATPLSTLRVVSLLVPWYCKPALKAFFSCRGIVFHAPILTYGIAIA